MERRQGRPTKGEERDRRGSEREKERERRTTTETESVSSSAAAFMRKTESEKISRRRCRFLPLS